MRRRLSSTVDWATLRVAPRHSQWRTGLYVWNMCTKRYVGVPRRGLIGRAKRDNRRLLSRGPSPV